MRRREFIAGFGGLVAMPRIVRAQQPAVPVVGFLNNSNSEAYREPVAAFVRGLADSGYVEGRNVAIEYRWAEDHYDRLPALAEELVRRQVAMIAATGNARLALTAKAATQTIPIVFVIGADPITNGLITSLARPGGNITGFTLLAGELIAIRLDLLHKLIPAATSIGYLWNPANYNPNTVRNEIVPPIFEIAARVLGVRLLAVGASNQSDIEEAFASLVQQRAGALLLTADPLFISHRDLIVALAARHAIPTIYFRHEFVPAGGLMSYDSNQADVYRRAGVYAGRILKGEKPADLPVQQPTKFELVINLKTAKTLGIEVPPTLLAIADEVIE